MCTKDDEFIIQIYVTCFMTEFIIQKTAGVRIDEKRDLLALGMKTQYENDVASGKIVIEED